MTSIEGDRSYSNLTSQHTIVAKKIISGSLSTNLTDMNSIITKEGTIDTLMSTNSMIDTLNSINGTIDTLNSTNGTIDTLNSTTGTIDTLNSININIQLGSVVQQTSTTTPVTINTSSGTIYTFISPLVSGDSFSFQVANNKIQQDSVILLTCLYGGLGTPYVYVESQSTGFCVLTVKNIGSVTFDEMVGIRFIVINPTT
jgi:hypothetical protein